MSNKSNTIDVDWLSQQIGRPSIYNIVHKVMALIEAGEIKAGMRLPSIRVLAKALNLSSTTVATALSELKARNIVRSQAGLGMTVVDNPVTAFPLRYVDLAADYGFKSLLNLSDTNPDPTLLPNLGRAMNYALKFKTSGRVSYCPIVPELKEAVLLTWPYLTESFVALDTPFEAITHLLKLLVPPGSYVAVENPGLVNVLDCLRRENINIIAVERDQGGAEIRQSKSGFDKKTDFVYLPTP